MGVVTREHSRGSLTCTCDIWGLLRVVFVCSSCRAAICNVSNSVVANGSWAETATQNWLGQRLKVPGNELECAAIACIKAGVLLPVDWDGLQLALE